MPQSNSIGWEKLLAWVSGRIDRELRLKIEYLAAENKILRNQIVGRPRFTDAQRITLATLGKKLGRKFLEDVASVVSPDTILRWHRDLIARKFDGSNPTDAWMKQAARNLTMSGCDLLSRCRYLLHDRDAKFSSGFNMIFRVVGIDPLALPPQSPNLNAFAERFVRSIKSECLDRMIFFGEASLRHAVTQYIEHYHCERPHQGKENRLLFPAPTETDSPRDGPVQCRKRLGGLLKFYYKEAA